MDDCTDRFMFIACRDTPLLVVSRSGRRGDKDFCMAIPHIHPRLSLSRLSMLRPTKRNHMDFTLPDDFEPLSDIYTRLQCVNLCI